MRDWAKRHILLTREERWLIAGIVLIFLIGLGARYLHRDRSQGHGEVHLPVRTMDP